MKLFICISVCLLLLTSCSNNDDTNSETICSVKNPIENLNWLKSEIDTRKKTGDDYSYVVQSQHNSQTVFIFGNCNPLANSVISVKTCDGEIVGHISDVTSQNSIPYSVLEEGKLVWRKSDKFMCDHVAFPSS